MRATSSCVSSLVSFDAFTIMTKPSPSCARAGRGAESEQQQTTVLRFNTTSFTFPREEPQRPSPQRDRSNKVPCGVILQIVAAH